MTDGRVAGIPRYFWCRDRCSMPRRLGGRSVQKRGREGKMESMEGGNWEQELPIDGLWLAYIIHYLGWAPELICVRQRGLIFSAWL